MPRGGPRPGSGRKPGSPNQRTRTVATDAAAAGQSPVEFLLSVMRDDEAMPAQRLEAAKAAAPYVHPRLTAVTYVNPRFTSEQISAQDMSDDELLALARGT